MSNMTIVAGSADGLRPPLAFRAGRMRPQLHIRFAFRRRSGPWADKERRSCPERVNEKVLTKLS